VDVSGRSVCLVGRQGKLYEKWEGSSGLPRGGWFFGRDTPGAEVKGGRSGRKNARQEILKKRGKDLGRDLTGGEGWVRRTSTTTPKDAGLPGILWRIGKEPTRGTKEPGVSPVWQLVLLWFGLGCGVPSERHRQLKK